MNNVTLQVTHRNASIAYKAGQEAKRQGIRLQDSAVSKLKVGSRQYEDFIAGYDGKAYAHG